MPLHTRFSAYLKCQESTCARNHPSEAPAIRNGHNESQGAAITQNTSKQAHLSIFYPSGFLIHFLYKQGIFLGIVVKGHKLCPSSDL